MALVGITRKWPDGEVLQVRVQVATSYPDALSEARATAVSALREASEIVTPVAEAEEEE